MNKCSLSKLAQEAAINVVKAAKVDDLTEKSNISRAQIYNIASGETKNPSVKTAYVLIKATNPELSKYIDEAAA